ncbi:hypothetical protein EJ08DRAFT_645895 [Tothia fuscella]|uniref:N-acetyltransferase domain-containing protein n=1 Tax=Tothia fuscella TaxID=1048955 RepID=A0A9P4U1S1_9PEZI|nr:hypothetical protein EJ08DRAFT_645895 [Tothia fuscella]
MSVIDNATNKVVACGHWDIFPDQRTPEQMEDLTSFPPAPASANADAWSDFFENFAERRRTILGTKPAAILCTLTTHPAHHRRGAGAMLMEQFLKNVDDAGLEAYLEASEMGKPLQIWRHWC